MNLSKWIEGDYFKSVLEERRRKMQAAQEETIEQYAKRLKDRVIQLENLLFESERKNGVLVERLEITNLAIEKALRRRER